MIDKGMIKKLSSAGVSPEVIVNLLLDEDEPEQAAEVRADPEQIAEAPKPAPAAPAAQPKPAQAAPEEPDKQDAILAAINKLTGAIQASNMRRDGMPGPDQAETTDTILANLLHPQPKS
jgi:hypothetical protein